MSLIYPKHQHPHGAESTKENAHRIWVCEECDAIKTDAEIKEDLKSTSGWIRCKAKKFKKQGGCESHFEPYVPDLKSIKIEDE